MLFSKNDIILQSKGGRGSKKAQKLRLRGRAHSTYDALCNVSYWLKYFVPIDRHKGQLIVKFTQENENWVSDKMKLCQRRAFTFFRMFDVLCLDRPTVSHRSHPGDRDQRLLLGGGQRYRHNRQNSHGPHRRRAHGTTYFKQLPK